MLERLHEHITAELQVNTRTDTIFVVTAVIFNFAMLGINSGVAAGAREGQGGATVTVVLAITLVVSLLVNGIAIVGLQFGRSTREKLLRGLLKMYDDAGVSQYYDASLLTSYSRRYLLFTIIVSTLGLVAIAIPLVIVWIR